MKRREFIFAVGGAASLAPFTARAQSTATPVIGYLHSGSAAPFKPQVAAFLQGLKQGGYTEGQNVTIEYRWAEGKADRLPALAAELVNRKVDVIAAMGGPPSNVAAKNATATIPVVFTTGADPVKLGLVTSLNRPGGNITGISFFLEELGPKALGLLHELVPAARTVGLMINPANPAAARTSADTVAAGRGIGLTVEVVTAGTPAEIDAAFDTLVARRAGALLFLGDPFFGSRLQLLAGLATRHRMPTMYPRREFAEAGGLMSYGTSIVEAYRQTGLYVARVLKGDRPGDLPVMQAVKFEFVLNLKAAKALGITVPDGFSARADEVIE